jgi:hypothetical protein
VRRAFLYASGTALALLAASGEARAGGYFSEVQLGLATGLEGAGTGDGIGGQRARTRLILGADIGNPESGPEAYGVRTFIELERSLSLGVELGYVRWFSPRLSLFFGGVGVLAPRTLFGGTAGANYVFPLGERAGLALFSSISALPLGNDRPGNGVVVWGLLGIGIRGKL